MDDNQFQYEQAFSRNLGWVTESEQQILRAKKIAIAGLGGVGGSHLLTLTRLGVGGFSLAEFDRFELANFNRQAGASLRSMGCSKLETMTQMALDINPELHLTGFEQGVSEENLDDFLQDVDIYVDSLDFFQLPIRSALFTACGERGIPAITAAPLGMGCAFLAFLPSGMSFEAYFGLQGRDEVEQYIRFLVGLSPAMLQMGYLIEPSRVDFNRRQGPSTPMACELCAGLAATQALKILLARGKVTTAPWGLHFDAYKQRLRKTWRPFGWRNPMQRLLISHAKRQFGSRLARSQP
ncbi:MAG TPA: hypothetical protein DCZ03_05395 [Gammaproteobacteria bacterium]|nr:hypothetical protein [Gammaproteobacteria bacterium]